MTRQAKLARLLAPCLVLAGCGHSPPTRFFTLDALPPGGATEGAVETTAFPHPIAPVQLDAVHIPAALDRPALVAQTAANRMKVEDQDQWVAPLGEMMRRTLAQDLLARLPAGSFILPGAPPPPGARGLVIDILQLQSEPGGEVVLQGSWTLMGGDPAGAILVRDIQLAANAAAAGPEGQAAATSRLLSRLADQIAATLAAQPQGVREPGVS